MAVIPVILFHLKIWPFSGGFLGVDVFFVISGYLITSIVLREYDSNKFSFKAFWLRRVRRILPVLVIVVFASGLAVYFLVFKGEHAALGFHGISALYSFANFTMWRMTGNYWGLQAENSPFLHTWSLSVEEQFYLIFPVTLYVVLRFRPRLVIHCFVVLMTASLVAFLYGAKHYPNATFYLLPMRAWELAAGALLAAIGRQSPKFLSNPRGGGLSIVGLFLIILSYFFVSDVSLGYLMPVLGATLVIAFAYEGPVYRILSVSPMVFIGKISYSLYMWHWPVIVFCRLSVPYSTYVSLILMLLFSLASYYWVEKPARFSPFTMPPLALGFTIALCISLWLSSSSGIYDVTRASQSDVKRFSQSVWKGLAYDVRPRADIDPGFRLIIRDVIVPAREEGEEDAFKQGGIIKHYSSADPQVVVLGDSHATTWSSIIDDVSKELHVTVSFYEMNGVPPFITIPIVEGSPVEFLSSEEKYLYDIRRVAFIRKWKPKLVIFVARWSFYSMKDVRPMFSFLESQAQHVLVIEQPPELSMGEVNLAQYLSHIGVRPRPGERQYLSPLDSPGYESGRALIRAMVKEFPKVEVAPVFDLYSGPHGGVWILDGKDLLYLDNNHLTEFGISKARSQLKKAIGSLLSE
jgi:peptidoglycan/LPS O-acetylase OafA/YrhL